MATTGDSSHIAATRLARKAAGCQTARPSGPPQESRAPDLQEGVVGTTEHGLRLLERVNLAGPCLLPHVEVLDQPVALHMKRVDVLRRGHELLRVSPLRLLERVNLA